MNAPGHDVTALLHAWTAGDTEARDRLMTVLYQELHRRAGAQLRRERPGHTLQPTALVHEAYLRLVDQRRVVWQNRGQFFGVACQIMRRILVDHARAHRMAKRSGQWARVTLDEKARAIPGRRGRAGSRCCVDTPRRLRFAQEPARGATLLWRALTGGSGRSARDLAGHRRTGLAGGARVAVEGVTR